MFQVSVPNVSFIFQTYVVSMFIWMFHIFHTYVASVLSGCCICFTHMLQVFYLDVANVYNGFQVFQVFFASV